MWWLWRGGRGSALTVVALGRLAAAVVLAAVGQHAGDERDDLVGQGGALVSAGSVAAEAAAAAKAAQEQRRQNQRRRRSMRGRQRCGVPAWRTWKPWGSVNGGMNTTCWAFCCVLLLRMACQWGGSSGGSRPGHAQRAQCRAKQCVRNAGHARSGRTVRSVSPTPLASSRATAVGNPRAFFATQILLLPMARMLLGEAGRLTSGAWPGTIVMLLPHRGGAGEICAQRGGG